MSEMVERAMWLAFEAHESQLDRGGCPYINHVSRVAEEVDGDAAKAAAWLHDVVEDTAWTLEGLRSKGFPEEVLAAVDALTKRAGETYTASMFRVMENPIALRVKLSDLSDNMDLSRLRFVGERDKARNKKYAQARELLLAFLASERKP